MTPAPAPSRRFTDTRFRRNLRTQTYFWLLLVFAGDKRRPEIRLRSQATSGEVGEYLCLVELSRLLLIVEFDVVLMTFIDVEHLGLCSFSQIILQSAEKVPQPKKHGNNQLYKSGTIPSVVLHALFIFNSCSFLVLNYTCNITSYITAIINHTSPSEQKVLTQV